MDVARVVETGFWRLPPPAPCRVSGLKPGRPPLPGDGSGDRHMPGGRLPLGPANGGMTEDWG